MSNKVDISVFLDALTALVGVDDVVTLLASIVAVPMVFILMWFGVKSAYTTFVSAVLGYRIDRGLADPEDYWIDDRGRWRKDWF